MVPVARPPELLALYWIAQQEKNPVSDRDLDFEGVLLKTGASFWGGEPPTGQHVYIARGGQMIDASFVRIPKQSLSKVKKARATLYLNWKIVAYSL